MSKNWASTLRLPKSQFPYGSKELNFQLGRCTDARTALDRRRTFGITTFNDAPMTSTSGRRPIAPPTARSSFTMARLMPTETCTLVTR